MYLLMHPSMPSACALPLSKAECACCTAKQSVPAGRASPPAALQNGACSLRVCGRQVVVTEDAPTEGQGAGAMPTESGATVLAPRPLLHCERLLELLVDLLSQLPTRRCVCELVRMHAYVPVH